VSAGGSHNKQSYNTTRTLYEIIIDGSPIPKPTPRAIRSDVNEPEGKVDEVDWAEDVVDSEGNEEADGCGCENM